MITVTVFEPNVNFIWFKNCHRDHIPFTVKGIGNIVFSVHGSSECIFGEICKHNLITLVALIRAKSVAIISNFCYQMS